jgi:hypothetical protein
MWHLNPRQQGKFPGTESQLLHKSYLMSVQECDFKTQVHQLQEGAPVEIRFSVTAAEEH